MFNSRLIVLAWALSTAVQAADEGRSEPTFALSIERQSLDESLQQLARQGGVQLIFFSRVTEGLNAPAIEGNYTLTAALELLLTGTGLTFRVINPQTVEVRPQQTRERIAPRAAGSSSDGEQHSSEPGDQQEEVVVVGLAEHLVATRIATPLLEIPQSVAIVSAEQMRQRNDVTLAGVLSHATGITTSRNSALNLDFFSRGYQITAVHVDGGAGINAKMETYDLYVGTPDLTEIDHVEILRGADGLFSGNGSPGGTVSLVRKRPQRAFAAELNAAAGSWEDHRFEFDVTGPLARDGALRGRVAAAHMSNGYFYDVDAHERQKIFGALEYDLWPAATLTLGGSYQWDRAAGIGNGLPFVGNGRDSHLPRETALEFDWTRYRSEIGGVYLQYRQELSADWALKFNAAGWRTEGEFGYGIFSSMIHSITGAMNERPDANFSQTPTRHTLSTVDMTLTGTLDWFGWREEIAIGADVTRVNVHSQVDGFFDFGTPLGNPRTFDAGTYPDPRLARASDAQRNLDSSLGQYGMFAALRIYFDDAWSIVGGARVGGDDTERFVTQIFRGRTTTTTTDFSTDPVVTPYAGIMYRFGRNYSIYASYADIYRAQSSPLERSPGERLGAVHGVNIEAGIKGAWRDGALNGSLAVYHVEQKNLPTSNPPTVPIVPARPLCCFRGIASESKGIDVEVSGVALPGWSIGAGYSFNVNEDARGGGRKLSPITPKHLFKAWTNVRLPGYPRWQVGGGMHGQTKTQRSSRLSFCLTPVSFCRFPVGEQGAYAVFDLSATFDVDRDWQVTLNLNNVFDKVYYESLGTDDLRVWYGEPRNWMLRIDGRF